MNFLLFTVLPALVVGQAADFHSGVTAFLILCAVWLQNRMRDNQHEQARKQQDNKLRDLQNELDILHQRINQQNQTIQALLRQPENAITREPLRQPENEQPENHLATDLSLSANTASATPRQPENHLAVPRQTARQPETQIAPVAVQPTIQQTIQQTVHAPAALGQPENQNDEFNLDTLDNRPAVAPSLSQSTAQPASAAHRQPETAWQNNEAEAAPNPLIAWFVRGNPLLKIGVVVLFFGLAFLLRYVGSHLPL